MFGLVVSALIALLVPPPVGELPNRELTPGVVRSEPIDVCAVKWGKDVRHVTSAMKRQVFESYGIKCRPFWSDAKQRCGVYEIDHFISRELAGADDVRNLWPQPFVGRWNAKMKDRLENRLHAEVCAGTITLQEAQAEIVADWRLAWLRRFGVRSEEKTR